MSSLKLHDRQKDSVAISIRKKVLFVTHSLDPYGACRSLFLTLKAFSGPIEVVGPKPWISKGGKVDLMGEANPQYLLRQPFRYCYEGHPKHWRFRISSHLKNILWKTFMKDSFDRWVLNRKFDLVHLNSLALVPMISRRIPTILHVRERLKKGSLSSDEIDLCKRLAGLIFIDESTKANWEAQFGQTYEKLAVIENPIDMRGIERKWTRESALKHLGIENSESTVFAMVGRIDLLDKGIDLVIRAFRSHKSQRSILLFFGDGTDVEIRRAEALARGDSRIHFLGKIVDQALIYSVTDVVVRGEPSFAVGRSLLEGLYSGAWALIPTGATSHTEVSIKKFADRCVFYEAQSAADLSQKFEELSGFRREESARGGTNVDESQVKFANFLSSI